MARDRSTPSFSVEIRNGRPRSSLKRGWAELPSQKVSKMSIAGDAAPFRKIHPTTAQAVFGSMADHAPGHSAVPSFSSTPRVLPDLSQGAAADVPVKPRRAYRRKEYPAEHRLSKTLQESASLPADAVDGEDYPASSDLHPPASASPSAEAPRCPRSR